VLLNVATVTIAILQILQQDMALRLLLPDGVFFAEARPGSTRFVIVSLVSSVEAPMFGGPAYKDTVYLVEARALTTAASSTDVENAFARCTTLLTDADLTMTGYGAMLTQFEEELESVEVDDIDPSIRWNRCGGHLHVMVAPLVG
jgi:hypothetical protein